MEKQLIWVFEWRKSVHYWWSYILFSPECKELTSMLDPLLYRWGVPPVVIRCVHWTMQMGVLLTWIMAQSTAIVMSIIPLIVWSPASAGEGDGVLPSKASNRLISSPIRWFFSDNSVRSSSISKLSPSSSLFIGTNYKKQKRAKTEQSSELHRPITSHNRVSPSSTQFIIRVDSRLATSQWETSLQSNAVSHWLGANLESALIIDTSNILSKLGKCHFYWRAGTLCLT